MFVSHRKECMAESGQKFKETRTYSTLMYVQSEMLNYSLTNHWQITFDIDWWRKNLGLLSIFFVGCSSFLSALMYLIVSGLPKNGSFFYSNKNEWHVVRFIHWIMYTSKQHWLLDILFCNYFTLRHLIDWNNIAK